MGGTSGMGGEFVKDPVEVPNFLLLDGGHRAMKVKKYPPPPTPEKDHIEQQ